MKKYIELGEKIVNMLNSVLKILVYKNNLVLLYNIIIYYIRIAKLKPFMEVPTQ